MAPARYMSRLTKALSSSGPIFGRFITVATIRLPENNCGRYQPTGIAAPHRLDPGLETPQAGDLGVTFGSMRQGCWFWLRTATDRPMLDICAERRSFGKQQVSCLEVTIQVEGFAQTGFR